MSKLSDKHYSLIMQCLIALAEGPFLDDEEFQTRLGVERSDVKQLIDRKDDLDTQSARVIINNCLNEVSHGIGFSVAEWNKWFTDPKEQIEDTYMLWKDYAFRK